MVGLTCRVKDPDASEVTPEFERGRSLPGVIADLVIEEAELE
tara:strand:+ start:853 stop:978 length:126 start_codon:yes stop_codon:yes gene_type:complete